MLETLTFLLVNTVNEMFPPCVFTHRGETQRLQRRHQTLCERSLYGVNKICLEIMTVMIITPDSHWCKISSSGSHDKTASKLNVAAKWLGSSALLYDCTTPHLVFHIPEPHSCLFKQRFIKIYTPECYHLTQRLNSCAIKAALRRCIVSLFPLIPSFDSFSQKQTLGRVPNHKLGSSLDTSNPNYFSISRPANLN